MDPLVLALNPSIDAEWRVADVLWEEKNDVLSERRWAGGKGINVARWLKYLGGRPQLLLPLGGRPGRELTGYLRAENISTRIVPLRAATRVNVIVTTANGRQMRFNAPSPKLSSAEWRAILNGVKRELAQRLGGLLILSGSLPRGVPANAYARLARTARRLGVRTLLDCDGRALAAAVAARPFLVKPNEHELAQWWGKPLRSESATLRAARALAARTGGWVLVSRGPQRAMLVRGGAREVFTATPRRVKPRNTVGAGDALLAAVAWQIQHERPPGEWLRAALDIGTAATRCEPGQVPPR